jgi:hypothetical protein
MIDATIGPADFGTAASTFRMKCTQHRCQAALRNTVWIATTSPV